MAEKCEKKNSDEIMKRGEEMILPIDEKIDEKCYEVNNIENWADCFYNLKTGIILERYIQIISKTENKKFFEALNYEYGVNNYPLDTKKAFEIYKTASDTSTDTLSMFRLYRIYKKDFKKFNIPKRNLVLEKYYLLKCYAYLTTREKNGEENLYQRFNVKGEIYAQIVNKDKKIFDWYYNLFNFLNENHSIYNLDKDEIIFVESVIRAKLNKSMDTKYFMNLLNFADKGNAEAMYELTMIYSDKEKSFYQKYYEKLYKLNYYRSFDDYGKFLDYGKDSLNIVKKSLLNGYYYHIKIYMEIFFMINELDDIFKSSELKTELMFIINCLIDNIIADEIDIFARFIINRKIYVKHFNFGNEFKSKFDLYIKEYLNYLMKFMDKDDEENKKRIKYYFLDEEYYKQIYTKLAQCYYYGVSGILDRDYNKCLHIFNYLIKNDGILYDDERFSTQYIYYINRNIRKKSKYSGLILKEGINDEELKKLEEKMIKFYFKEFSVEKVQIFFPSGFYILSRFYNSFSINNEDILFEYVLLNRAANSQLLRLKGYSIDYSEEKYYIYKARKKVIEKNKEENFNKIKLAKGIINVGGYGEDGTICPICFDRKKSIICLPCKHFFCKICMDQMISAEICPICRTEIKIIFDFNLKKENLIKSILSNSHDQ